MVPGGGLALECVQEWELSGHGEGGGERSWRWEGDR